LSDVASNICQALSDGAIRIWDLRLGGGPFMSFSAAGAAGDGDKAQLQALSVRGGLIAAGYANGGVAVFDWASGGACVWSELLHEGECRSVDLCPAGKLLLSGGFDGACRVGGLLRTSTRPTLNRRTRSAQLYAHTPSRWVMLRSRSSAGSQ